MTPLLQSTLYDAFLRGLEIEQVAALHAVDALQVRAAILHELRRRAVEQFLGEMLMRDEINEIGKRFGGAT